MGSHSGEAATAAPYPLLLEQFSALYARNVDLLHDMGPSETFLVDLESLVLEAVHMPR